MQDYNCFLTFYLYLKESSLIIAYLSFDYGYWGIEMKNEYLISSKEDLEKVKKEDFAVELNVVSISNTENYVVSYKLSGENEQNASVLDKLHTKMLDFDFKITILECGSSKYYNKRLFPLINSMERKIRKLVYLATATSENESVQELIKDLESLTFNEIYQMLFLDDKFINETKKLVNKKEGISLYGKGFTKRDILTQVSQLEEFITWDNILNPNAAPTLRLKFKEAKTYRNNVMHAHNITKDTFNKAYKLYKMINEELDKEIIKIRVNSLEVSSKIFSILSEKIHENKKLSFKSNLLKINFDDETFKPDDLVSEQFKIYYSKKYADVINNLSKNIADYYTKALRDMLDNNFNDEEEE